MVAGRDKYSVHSYLVAIICETGARMAFWKPGLQNERDGARDFCLSVRLHSGCYCCRQFLFLSEVLQWRAQTTPDHVLYTLLNSRGATSSSLTCVQLHKRAEKIAAMLSERGQLQDGDHGATSSSLTCVQLHKRAEKIAAMLSERGQLQDGDHVALVYPPGLDLIVAFYGCLYAGCVPITVRPPHPQNIATTLPTVKMIVEVSRSVCVMTTQGVARLLRSREAMAAVDVRSWPPVMDTGSFGFQTHSPGSHHLAHPGGRQLSLNPKVPNNKPESRSILVALEKRLQEFSLSPSV
ncbi:unnamed protein product [Menidia menidia]|uniref:(Atlantic silverside) hypothetical protein n=1 Tax=Menidia menidia TaxID=238744 RepID=A0A8S4AGQ0_9TELE|nr:unnamed protein product [Menidia menidia]